MSKENVELVHRFAELASAGDISAVDDVYHPDAELRDLQPAPGLPEVQQGRAEIRAGLEQWLEVMDDWTIEIEEAIDADPWVVGVTRWKGRGRESDVEVDWRIIEAHEIRDGKIARSIYNFPDVAAALEAVEEINA